jgi:RNA polymerase sigma factor (sigma-70 family)
MNQADNRATLCCQRSQWTGFQRSRGFMRRIGMTISGEPSPVARGSVAEQDADRVLVSALQRRRGAELYAFARRLGLSPEAADDAVQESLLRLWVTLNAGTAIAQPDAWVFRAIYRICMDNHRWRRRAGRLMERLRPRSNREVHVSVADRLTVWEAVDRLPERQRVAVYLRYRADLAYEEIGAILGINPVSARSNVSRALDRLGDILAKEDFR